MPKLRNEQWSTTLNTHTILVMAVTISTFLVNHVRLCIGVPIVAATTLTVRIAKQVPS